MAGVLDFILYMNELQKQQEERMEQMKRLLARIPSYPKETMDVHSNLYKYNLEGFNEAPSKRYLIVRAIIKRLIAILLRFS